MFITYMYSAGNLSVHPSVFLSSSCNEMLICHSRVLSLPFTAQHYASAVYAVASVCLHHTRTHAHTHNRLTASGLGQPR